MEAQFGTLIVNENVQKRAARFVTRNYSYETCSLTVILEELKWETLQKRRKDNRLILLYKGLKGKARIPTDDLSQRTGVAEINTHWSFRFPLLVKMQSFFPPNYQGLECPP